MAENRRLVAVIGLGIAVVVLFEWYLQLRRGHEKDFPFMWGSLYLNGILLIVAGALLVAFVVMAARGTRSTQIIGAAVLGLPSLALATVDYLFIEVELDAIPGRLIQDPGHQLGMVGLGISLGLLVLALLDRQRPATDVDDEPTVSADVAG